MVLAAVRHHFDPRVLPEPTELLSALPHMPGTWAGDPLVRSDRATVAEGSRQNHLQVFLWDLLVTLCMHLACISKAGFTSDVCESGYLCVHVHGNSGAPLSDDGKSVCGVRQEGSRKVPDRAESDETWANQSTLGGNLSLELSRVVRLFPSRRWDHGAEKALILGTAETF